MNPTNPWIQALAVEDAYDGYDPCGWDGADEWAAWADTLEAGSRLVAGGSDAFFVRESHDGGALVRMAGTGDFLAFDWEQIEPPNREIDD